MGKIIGYRCIADCQLDYTNFMDGEEIIISNHCEDNDWKGTDFFDNHPHEFDKILESESFSIDGEEETLFFVGNEEEARERFNNDIETKWNGFKEWCEMELTQIY